MKQMMIIAFILSGLATAAQQDSLPDRVKPGIRYGRVSRAAEISINNNLLPFRIKSRPAAEGFGANSGRVDDHPVMTIKLKAPLYNGKYDKFIFGFKHIRESFDFRARSEQQDYISNLDKRVLRSIGGTIYSVHYLTGRRSLTTRAELSFNGDYSDPQLSFREVYKLNITASYGVTKSADLMYGIGLSYSQRMGRRNIYPVLLYQRNFSSHWALYTVFPANVMFQYRPSQQSFVSFGYEVQGSTYTLRMDEPSIPALPLAELRINRVDFPLKYEQRLYDFIWCEFAMGYGFFLTNRIDYKRVPRNIPYIRSKTPGFIFGEATLLFTIPRKLSQDDNDN